MTVLLVLQYNIEVREMRTRKREVGKVALVNPVQTGVFFLKNYKRHRHETYTTN